MRRRLPSSLVDYRSMHLRLSKDRRRGAPHPRSSLSKPLIPFQVAWESVWAALVMSEGRPTSDGVVDVSCRKGSFLIHRWVREVRHRGLANLVRILKELCLHLRAYAIEKRRRPCPRDFPRKLYRFLLENLTAGGLLTFSTLSRALPECEDKVEKARALLDHAEAAFHPFRKVSNTTLSSVRAYVREGFRRGGTARWGFPRLSTSAVSERPGSKGGYTSYILDLWADEGVTAQQSGLDPIDPQGADWGHYSTFGGFFEHESARSVSARPWASGLVWPLLDAVESMRDDDGAFDPIDLARVESLEANAYAASRFSVDESPTHRVCIVSERGYKLRVVTAPPASLVAAAELARQATFPVVRDDDRLSILRGGDPLADLPPCPDGKTIVSADLTKATDGFSHEVIRAVGLGMRDAGVPEPVWRTFVETLGAGNRTHLFKYKVSELLPTGCPHSHRERLLELGWDGSSPDLLVPVRRGSPMGTPCSFTLLCIVNGWAASHADHVRICGDDLMAVFDRREHRTYSDNVRSVGSSLSQPKTFLSSYAGTFCERFVVRDGARLERVGVVPVKLATVPRKGALGVLSSPAGIPVYAGLPGWGEDLRQAWVRTRRVFRTLWRDHRAAAASRKRYPEVPTKFGGLGHPGKGLRSIPGHVRSYLYDLARTEDNRVWLNFHRSVQPIPAPVGGSRGWAGVRYQSRVAASYVDSHLHGAELARAADIASFEALTCITNFVFMGGSFKKSSATGKLSALTRLRAPALPSSGRSYSRSTPVRVLFEDFERVINAGLLVDDELYKRIRRVDPSELPDALYASRGLGGHDG
uniref:RNA-dependent RNA polymerase n=1 Tax=Narnavirus sp. TaxID=2587225 RepID=A0A6B9I7G5_9VIRU|nr:RNA-dependent RNA polymerase [Narnavirus sp.]